jgi:small subunit ribosomal protein S4
LENRFDNIIFRLGFASSHAQARQFVNHGHFSLNNRRVTIPSHQLKKGDKVSIYPVSQKMKMFENLKVSLKKHQLPSWLKLDTEKLEGEVLGLPTLEESALPGEISAIFEYYSR